jgi:hypothetical protein
MMRDPHARDDCRTYDRATIWHSPFILHCDEPGAGVKFGLIWSLASIVAIPYGLLFRSLACRDEFSALDPSTWVLQ